MDMPARSIDTATLTFGLVSLAPRETEPAAREPHTDRGPRAPAHTAEPVDPKKAEARFRN
jgi:hypothetical protein